ncbi:MAG: hypothetical protein V1799_19560 [bacterium]
MKHSEAHIQLELKNDLTDLSAALEGLQYSNEKCTKIGLKASHTFEEQESFDSLSSKFARIADLYSQKILKTIFLLLRENPRSFIDKANLAEKLEMIPSADELILIRDLRNEIVHEYLFSELPRINSEIIARYPSLLRAIDSTKAFIQQRGW